MGLGIRMVGTMPTDTENEKVDPVDESASDSQSQEKLKSYVAGAVCRHRSWGVGQIASRDDALGSLLIDFRSKKGHAMEFEYASQTLRILTEEHFEARILKDPASVKEQAGKDPGELMKQAVQQLGREATTTRLEEAFVPHLFQVADWKKFWEAAKRAMRKDARFVIPSKRTDPIQYLESAAQSKGASVEELREAVGVKRVIEVLEKLQKSQNAAALKSQAEEIFKLVDAAGQKVPKSQVGQVAELALARAEFSAGLGLPAEPGAVLRGILPAEPSRLALVVETLPVFPLALVGSLLMRWLVERCGADQLVSGPIQNRVGSVSADLLIAAATACLDLSLLAHDWLPLLVLSTAGLAWNLAILLLLAPRMLPPPWFSRGIIEFGQATGVAASGLLLLNMADPEDRGDALTPFSIKQLLIQPLLAGGVITVVAPLAVVSWGLGAWTALSLVVVLLAGGTGLWLGRGNNAAQKPPEAPGQSA